MRIFLAILVAAGLGCVAALHFGYYTIPERYNPLAPLRIDDEPNLLTRFKLARVGMDSALCLNVLAEADLAMKPIADRTTGPGCGFENAVTVSRIAKVPLSSPTALSCRSAVSTAMWEKHVVAPAALEHFGQPLARIEHLGSYSCRNVYGEPNRPRSQHATADALDVSAFVLGNGRRISVLGDWKRSDASSSAFLHEVHDGACAYFDGVLGPNYNAAHSNHFHLDRGPYRMCR